MNRLLLFAMAFVVWLASSDKAATAGERVFAQVHYLPFHVDTYAPVTRETIASTGRAAFAPFSSLKLMWVMDQIFHARRYRTFDEDVVRVHIALPSGERIYIDRYGGVRRKDADLALPPGGLDDLAKTFEQILLDAAEKQRLQAQWAWALEATRARIAAQEKWPQSD